MLKGYCEHNSHRSWLREWETAQQIELVHFPYDAESFVRRTSARAVTPSAATWNDTNLTWNQAGERLGEVAELVQAVGADGEVDGELVDRRRAVRRPPRP